MIETVKPRQYDADEIDAAERDLVAELEASVPQHVRAVYVGIARNLAATARAHFAAPVSAEAREVTPDFEKALDKLTSAAQSVALARRARHTPNVAYSLSADEALTQAVEAQAAARSAVIAIYNRRAPASAPPPSATRGDDELRAVLEKVDENLLYIYGRDDGDRDMIASTRRKIRIALSQPPVAASAGSEPDLDAIEARLDELVKAEDAEAAANALDPIVRQLIAELRSHRLALSGSEATALSSLRWAMGYINDDASNGIPPHDCEFIKNPEKGACDFHEQWVMAMQAAGLEIEPEDAATQGSRAPAMRRTAGGS